MHVYERKCTLCTVYPDTVLFGTAKNLCLGSSVCRGEGVNEEAPPPTVFAVVVFQIRTQIRQQQKTFGPFYLDPNKTTSKNRWAFLLGSK